MNTSGRLRWFRAVILLGVVYLVAGIAFAALANRAASNQIRVAWRLAAWVISAAGFATHIAYEHVRQRSSPGNNSIARIVGCRPGGLRTCGRGERSRAGCFKPPTLPRPRARGMAGSDGAAGVWCRTCCSCCSSANATARLDEVSQVWFPTP